MQLARTRLTQVECQRRIRKKLCLYCGQEGHLNWCPELPANMGTLVSRISSFSSSRIQVQGTIHSFKQSLPVQVLVDLGADDNFIDVDFVKTHQLHVTKLASPKEVVAIDSKSLDIAIHRTEPLNLILSSNHVILGIPWLKKHNPHVDWATASIRNWSANCHASCLQSAFPARPAGPIKSLEVIDLTNVPKEYHDLREVFSKDAACSLPPHRPYDCAIDLLHGASLLVCITSPGLNKTTW